MPNGTVKFFNAAKGFGFITPDDGAKDIFVPATSITAAGITSLKAGQRVSFAILPDTKGPKAVELKIIAPVHPPKAESASPAKSGKSQGLTLYVDPNTAEAGEVLAELRRSGHEPRVVDYIATPPSKEELKRISLVLRESDQSMVRKFEPLFHELRLDDRFISDAEYWEAIFEHPLLINGPIVATAFKAGVCHSKASVKAFLAVPDSDGAQSVPKRKGLSPGLLRLMSGAEPLPAKKAPIEQRQPKVEAPPQKTAKVAAKPKPVDKPKTSSKGAVKAKPKPKAPVRKAVKKPAAKAGKR